MADIHYPGLELVENFLNNFQIDRIDMVLECAGDQPSKKGQKYQKTEDEMELLPFMESDT